MSDAEVRNRLKALFAAKQGADLIDTIADEIADLHAQMSRVADDLRLLPVYESFSDRLGVLMDSGAGESVVPDRLKVDASHLFAAENGFYAVEHDEHGRPYRWTGPSRDFSFVVYLDRRAPLRLELEIASMVEPKLQSDILLLADGTNVPFQIVREKDCYIGRAVLPRRGRTRATSLIFVVPQMMPEPKGLDPRYRGVAFRELRIEPEASGEETASVVPTETEQSAPVAWLMSAGSTPMPARLALENRVGNQRPHSISRYNQANSGLDLVPGMTRIDADRIEEGVAGFFRLEKDQEGRSYRWTGPGKIFSLTVSVDRSKPVRMRLCLVGFADRRRQTPLTVSVDGSTRTLSFFNDPDGNIAQVVLPRRSSGGPTTLTFTVAAVIKPSSADRRFLGVAFRYLAIEPVSRATAAKWLLGRFRRKATRIYSGLVARSGARRPAPGAATS